MKIDPRTLKGISSVIGGLMIHLVCGVLYMWGSTNAYIFSW